MSCPVCRGSKDPRALALESRCDAHLAEVRPLTRREVEGALRQGLAARAAALNGWHQGANIVGVPDGEPWQA